MANIRRLINVELDKTLDQRQARLLGSVALRTLRLWRETVNKGRTGADGDAKSLQRPGKELYSMVDATEPVERRKTWEESHEIDEDRLRDDVIGQLRKNLGKSREMLNPKRARRQGSGG